MTTKDNLIRYFLNRSVREALLLKSTEMSDRGVAEYLRQLAPTLAEYTSWYITEDYKLLELYDIFEWKKQRVRR